ncbi:T9SS type A sorting domain-containing protein [Pontibacter sp. SGAir0037]|uniref:T9SS type A sorting domain-containing protein n=1 Tax=Pontibacter sp. SGAir0037 TaxID=2571030 RepID=UPI0010CD2D86|nr:T9SS type A sorting domain-containing protein [Pontibacter sp. SGAir0037]QCR22496.1 hypothetical protein C1N53_09215 [Pontibacter sp. SGAir0037]
MKLRRRILTVFACAVCTYSSAFASDPTWYGNDHFKITPKSDYVTISMSKHSWETFSVDLKDVLSKEGVLSFEVKAEQAVLLRVDGFTANNTQVNLFSNQVMPGSFQQLSFDLTAVEHQVENLIFYLNPGEDFTGEIQIKELKVTAPFLKQEVLAVYPNPTTDFINVQLPTTDEFDQVQIFDNTGQVISTIKPDSKEFNLDLKGYKPGMYFLKAQKQGTKNYISTKFIVK